MILDINKGVTMEIEGRYLDHEQRFDYADRLAKIQAEQLLDNELVKKYGELPDRWRQRVIDTEAAHIMQDFIKAQWNEYGYDEEREIAYLRAQVSDDDARRAMSFVIDEGVE